MTKKVNKTMKPTNLIAKPVVRNKFWIVEDEGKKVATIQKAPDGVVFVQNESREKFPTVKLLESKYNILFDKKKKVKKEEVTDTETFINGYPTAHTPYNILTDLKNHVQIYTKSSKSKSYFCAGYFLIQFVNGWVPMFCPKLITIERYRFMGPFKSKIECQAQLKKANDEANSKNI